MSKIKSDFKDSELESLEILLGIHFNTELQAFMLESNSIEGEHSLNPNDLFVAKEAFLGIKDLKHLKGMHRNITAHLDVAWGGRWRTVNVRVGSYHPPKWQEVPELMLQYWSNFKNMDAWHAHNEFENIHPFQDFNGRMGRLIWLSKAVKEGYKFNIPFLQKYYYQTLDNYQRK